MMTQRLLKNATGFGLYDQEVIELFRQLDDPYPYVRGIISDFGFPVAQIPFMTTWPVRCVATRYVPELFGFSRKSK
jgi:hypothetical protein